MPAPRDDRVRRAAQRWWPLAVIAVLAAGVAAFLWLIPESGPTAGRQAAATQSVGSSSGTPAGPITLADCQITPAASPLAFAGWTTLAALNVHGGDAGPGQPIYAVVTRGMAEWVGWQEHYTGPMFPPPIGRMGCIFDPSTRKTSLVGVDLDWEPSLMADGCPPSPIDEFGGHREFGGPHAWLLLPDDISAWQVGENKILFRLSSPAAPGQSITAWTQPLADAGAIPAQVDSNTGELGPPDTSGSGSRYYFVTALFSSAGCWVINIAINGQVVGSAIAPITAAPLQALHGVKDLAEDDPPLFDAHCPVVHCAQAFDVAKRAQGVAWRRHRFIGSPRQTNPPRGEACHPRPMRSTPATPPGS